MLINRKVFTAMTLAFAIFGLSIFVSAQETKADKPATKEDQKRGQGFDRKMEGKHGEKGMKGSFGRRGMRGHHAGRSMMRSLRGIELSETQKTQIKSLMEANKVSFQGQHEEMKGLMLKKRDGSLTEADTARIDQFKSERKASAEQTKNTIMGLLTPEQTTKLNQMKAERQQRMMERKQRWMERKQKGDTPKENK